MDTIDVRSDEPNYAGTVSLSVRKRHCAAPVTFFDVLSVGANRVSPES